MRLGPQQAGPFGLLQTLADTIKLVLKEDITPTQADAPVFRVAPFLVFAPVAIVAGRHPVRGGVGAVQHRVGRAVLPGGAVHLGHRRS